MTDEELMQKIDDALSEYRGQIDDFYIAVGFLIVGRLLGWRVMRLAGQRRHYAIASKIFGDIRQLTPERGKYFQKSLALKISDKLGGYWDYVRGSAQAMPLQDRKTLI